MAAARIEPAELARAQQTLAAISRSFDAKVVGQAGLRESLLVGLMTGGHILLESVPGLAKTTAAQTVAEAISADFRRIQCTPDLLPSDIVGTQLYDAAKGTFVTQLGPVHANIVLLDEINRSSAKTQSAMLEAMQERQTSIGGVVHPLPAPFLVLATQNPIEQEGTYLLPEAQMDRFMLKDVLDYPTPAEEAEIIRRIDAGVFTPGAETRRGRLARRRQGTAGHRPAGLHRPGDRPLHRGTGLRHPQRQPSTSTRGWPASSSSAPAPVPASPSARPPGRWRC